MIYTGTALLDQISVHTNAKIVSEGTEETTLVESSNEKKKKNSIYYTSKNINTNAYNT